MAAPAGAIGKGVAAVGDAASALPIVGRALASPFVQAAATGAGTGALDATGHDQSAAMGALVGAGAGAGGQLAAKAATGLVSKAAGMFNPAVMIPTEAALKQAAQGVYQGVDNAGVSLTSQAAQKLADAIEQTKAARSAHPANEPGVAAVDSAVAKFLTAPGATPSLADIDAVRQAAGNMSGSPSSLSLGSAIKSAIDNHLDALTPNAQNVVNGDLPGALDAWKNARGLWSSFRKSEAVTNAQDAASLNAGASGIGGNINNATRQQAKALLNSGTKWTPDEEAALRQIVQGTTVGNALRAIGGLAPTSNAVSLLTSLGTGGAGFAAGGAARPRVGRARRRLSATSPRKPPIG